MKIERAVMSRDIMDDRASQGVFQFFDAEGAPVLFFGTHGYLYTLENPWLDNERNISCIPAGDYICRRVLSPSYGETFEIVDVEGRTHILFHWGNWVKNTDGCVLLGVAREDSDPAIWSSRSAHAAFMEAAEGVDEFPLTILEEAA